MNILYGVTGEGLGHAMRSRVVLEHLVDQEHNVEIVASGRAVDYLARRFEGVNRIHGMHMIYEENRVHVGKTLVSNVLGGATGIPKNIAAYFELIGTFRPQAVISDFESWTYVYAKMHRLPILSIDNMQIINRCSLPEPVLRGHRTDFRLTRAFIKSKLPFCDEYFVTSFFRPRIRKPRTRIFPPILRPEILAARAERGGHLLVYTTGEGNKAIAAVLADTGLECRIYGMRRKIETEQAEGNLRYMPFSEPRFIEDLASCRAVVAGGGFTLMGEAVYLRKPMLAIPVARQFEQILNARYLAWLGYGREADTLENASAVQLFLASLDDYEANLAGYEQDGNEAINEAINEWIDKVAAGVA